MIRIRPLRAVASGFVEGSLRGRDFRLLLAASAFSSLGDELALIALTIKVANLTNSGVAVGALLVAGLLPLVIFAPAAGVIVDNFETTRTLALATAAQAVVAVGLAFATGLPILLMLAFLLGTGAAVANPALYTLVPAVVGDERATEANAYLETARYAGMIIGPLLAGTLSARIGSKTALLVDAGTFVAIAIAALALTVRRRPAESADDEPTGAARAGLAVIRRDALLVVAFTVFAGVIIFAAMDNVAEVFFADQTLNADGWGYGLLASAWLAGLVLGAALIARRLPARRLVPALLTASVVLGLAVGGAAALAMLVPAVLLFAVGGAANGVQSVSMRSLIVHRVEDRYRGRAFAAYGGMVYGMQLVALAAAGALVVALGGRAVLLIGGAGCVTVGLLGAVWYRLLPPDVRAMPDDEPEHVQVPDSAHVLRLPEIDSTVSRSGRSERPES